MSFPMSSAVTPPKRTFLKIILSYLQRTVLLHLSSSQPQLMFHTIPLNIFMEHLTILWLVSTVHVLCLKPMASTQSVSLQLQREPKEPRLKTSVTSQTKNPKAGKSQESSSSDCNFEDFEKLESLNCNRSSFAKRQLQDYWCNLLIKFHTSYQDMSTIKNIPKEHLQWVKQMAKRSAINDSLLMYRDEFMEDPNHYCIMVPNDIQLQCHLLKVYHDSPVSMHRGREATYGSLPYDFYWQNMAKHVQNWIR